jgi:hypothetical protein
MRLKIIFSFMIIIAVIGRIG